MTGLKFKTRHFGHCWSITGRLIDQIYVTSI